jgi:hypothetical protein
LHRGIAVEGRKWLYIGTSGWDYLVPMGAAGYRKENLKLGFLTSLIILAVAQAAFADPMAEAPHSATLEDFLKGLRYEPVKLKIQQGHPLVKGELRPGKKCVFLVDTGWSITTLDRSVAGRLKSIKERGVVLDDTFLGVLSDSSLVLIDKLVLGRAEFMNQPARVEKLEMV